jgi:pimeloyl-ACP methyl ester carboxylesterase
VPAALVVAVAGGLVARAALDGAATSDDDAPRRVTFTASDGVRLSGTLFGSGSVAIVLSHMGDSSDNQTEWYPMARVLASRGYEVLAYNTRGVCPGGRAGCSLGRYVLNENWKDIVGAYTYLRNRGADRVALMGGSVGAMGSLVAAGKDETRAAAVVAISGVLDCCGYLLDRSDLRAVSEPKLFIAGSYDSWATDGTRAFYRWSRSPKRLRIFQRTNAHGTDLLRLDEPTGRQARRLVLQFLDRFAPA